MRQPELVFFAPVADGAAELVVNFGVYAAWAEDCIEERYVAP